jgi:hypothetical protein
MTLKVVLTGGPCASKTSCLCHPRAVRRGGRHSGGGGDARSRQRTRRPKRAAGLLFPLAFGSPVAAFTLGRRRASVLGTDGES